MNESINELMNKLMNEGVFLTIVLFIIYSCYTVAVMLSKFNCVKSAHISQLIKNLLQGPGL